MSDKLALMMEADRRGLLPPEQKALLEEAIKRGLVDKPAVVEAGDTLRQIPRQVGLTARYGMEGLADAAGVVTEPIRAITNPLLRAVGLPGAQSVRETASWAADKIGLPSPQGPTERVVGDATRLMAGSAGMTGVANQAVRTAQTVGAPVVERVATAVAANPGTQVASGAGAGLAGGAVRESGGGPWEQFFASLAGGLSAAGLTSLGSKVVDGLTNWVSRLGNQRVGPQEVNVVLTEILQGNGINMSQVPTQVRADLAREVQEALSTGRQVNPEVLRRIADYGVVGATPTRGSVTLDPVQITQERNLAKVGANSTDPRLQQLARVQNENNTRLIENLNQLGANTQNSNNVTAGQRVVGAVQARDNAARATENALYGRAREAAGRQIDLDREAFITDAYNRLGESNKNAFLPENIRSLLEQIRGGTLRLPDGTERQVPFNVDVIDNLKTILATASRAAQDGNTRSAIAQVRNALENVQPRAVGRTVGGNQVVDPAALAVAQGQADDASTAAMSAFDRARRFAAARRNWQESSPGIAAALEDVPADRFIQEYVIGSGNKAATRELETLLNTVRRDPEAMQAIRDNVMAFLKGRALNGAADEVGNFSQSAFNKALNDIGDFKLRMLFSPEQVSQLRAIGRVAAYEQVQPRGSAVNNSNTASGLAGLLDRIANNELIGRIPFADAAVRAPARNWSAQINVQNAMDPYSAVLPQAATGRNRLLDTLAGPGLLLSAPRADGSNDKGRR